MNNRWKKIVSLFLALSIVCSLAVVPAGAAGEALTLSAENGAWSGQQYTVDIVAKGTGSFNVAVVAATVEFKNDLLTFVGAEDKTGFSMVQAPNVTAANTNGHFNLGPADANGGKTFTSTMPIATLTFQLKDGVENQNTELTFKDVDIQTAENEAYVVTSVPATISITNGAAPTVETVTIDKESVTVDGTEGATANVTATSKLGADLTKTVAWTVTPADSGVTVDKGVVTVSATAKAQAYTIGAGTKTVTLTVNRAAAVAKSIVLSQNSTEISGDTYTLIKPTEGKTNTYTFEAKVLDQYGDPFEGTVAWTCSSALIAGVTVENNTVTVDESADVDTTFTLTAAVGTVSKGLTLTVKDINITWPTASAEGGVYGMTWKEIVKLSGGSAELNGPVNGTFSVKDGDQYPQAGAQNYVVNFKSADGQYDVDSAPMSATIAKKAVTIKMKDQQVSFGDTFAYYDFETVIKGKPDLLFSEDEVRAAASGDAKEDGTSPVGVYKIKGTAEHQNYAVTVEDGILTIVPKAASSDETISGTDVEDEIDGNITSGSGTATVEITVNPGSFASDTAKSLADALLKAFGGEKKITVTVGGSTVELTVTGWKLADGQKYNSTSGTYLFVPVYAEAGYENISTPAAPAFLVTLPAKQQGTVVTDLDFTLHVNDILNAERLSSIVPTQVRIDYPDGSHAWVNIEWDSDLLEDLKAFAKDLSNGSSKTFYATGKLPASANAGSTVSLSIRVRNTTSTGSTGGSTNNRGTGSNLSFTLDPNKLFLNNLPKDVSSTYWAANSIGWAYARGVMGGMADGNFHPEGLTNRQQLWMVLDRLSGNKPANMAEARAWSIRAGISDGTNPTSSLTRQQLVTMLYRYAQLNGYATTGGTSLSGYADAGRVSSYAQAAMSWAVGNGIVGGANGNLNPQGTATRAHFATFLYRFCVKYGA